MTNAREPHLTLRSHASNPQEARVNLLWNAVTGVIRHAYDADHWPDGNTTKGYGQILEGMSQLLNDPLGGLDGGELSREIDALAEYIGWDLQTSEMKA
jgi:hypothetical protein